MDFDERVAQAQNVGDGGNIKPDIHHPRDGRGASEGERTLEMGAVDRYRADPAYVVVAVHVTQVRPFPSHQMTISSPIQVF